MSLIWSRSLTVAAAASILVAGVSHAQTPDPKDYRIIRKVPRAEADRWLKEELTRSGADLNRERYHFVLAFSTGHYGSDPVHAIAMRRLAFGWLNNTFSAGDQVTPAAWEMTLWDAGKPIPLSGDPTSRAAFVDAVPYAPQPGSRGGHDTERALYEVLQKAVPRDKAQSTVVLLLTNTNQSQVPTGSRERLFGAGNPKLTEALRSGGFRAPVRHSFVAEGKDGPLTIDVTAVFPEKIKSLPNSPSFNRYPTFSLESWQPAADQPGSASELPNSVGKAANGTGANGSGPTLTPQGPAKVQPEGGFPWPILIGALVLLAAVAAFVLLRKKPAGKDNAPAPTTPKGRPFPGSIRATIGRGAAAKSHTLTPLTSLSRWDLVRGANGIRLEAWENGKAPDLAGAALMARMTLNEKGQLRLTAEPDAQLKLTAGQNSEGDSREIRLQRDGRALCELQSATSTAAAERLELVYSGK